MSLECKANPVHATHTVIIELAYSLGRITICKAIWNTGIHNLQGITYKKHYVFLRHLLDSITRNNIEQHRRMAGEIKRHIFTQHATRWNNHHRLICPLTNDVRIADGNAALVETRLKKQHASIIFHKTRAALH